MNFIADLHIHSRFSRATSKQLSPRHLAAWARCKGINVLGTGDFTHPQWRDELRQQLVRDEASGFFHRAADTIYPAKCLTPVHSGAAVPSARQNRYAQNGERPGNIRSTALRISE